MHYDVHDGSGHGRTANTTPDVVVPRIEHEDEEAVTFSSVSHAVMRHAPGHASPGTLNQPALGAIIDRQARTLGIDGMLEIRETPSRLELRLEDLRLLGDCEGDDESGRRAAIKNRVLAAGRQAPFLPLQTSVNVYTALRGRFQAGLPRTVDLTTDWPVVPSDEPGVETATADLARFYRLRGTPAAGCHPAPLTHHDRDQLRQALEDLRADSGGKIVALHNDWRMWLAWLAAGNPIICLGALSKNLTAGMEGSTAPDPEKPLFKHTFIIAGYAVTGDGTILQASDAIEAGQRLPVDVPVEVIVRNSGNPRWGNGGKLRIPYAHFQNQFREAYGFLLNDASLAPTLPG